MAHTIPQIAAPIHQVEQIAEPHLVFKVEFGNPRQTLVVKAELNRITPTRVKWGSGIMKAASDPKVNIKVLTPGELALLNAHPGVTLGMFTPAGCTWTKMPHVPYIQAPVGEIPTVPPNRSLAEVKHVAAVLNDQAQWRELGKVVAADIFIGNQDRFSFDANDDTPTLQNAGNLTIAGANQGNAKIMGLDPLDPFASDFTRIDPTPQEVRLLANLSNPTDEFALALVRAATAGIKKQMRRASPGQETTTIGSANGNLRFAIRADDPATEYDAYAPQMKQGLEEGRDALKAYLQAKHAKYNPPNPLKIGTRAPPLPPRKVVPGPVYRRMVLLGWAEEVAGQGRFRLL